MNNHEFRESIIIRLVFNGDKRAGFAVECATTPKLRFFNDLEAVGFYIDGLLEGHGVVE